MHLVHLSLKSYCRPQHRRHPTCVGRILVDGRREHLHGTLSAVLTSQQTGPAGHSTTATVCRAESHGEGRRRRMPSEGSACEGMRRMRPTRATPMGNWLGKASHPFLLPDIPHSLSCVNLFLS